LVSGKGAWPVVESTQLGSRMVAPVAPHAVHRGLIRSKDAVLAQLPLVPPGLDLKTARDQYEPRILPARSEGDHADVADLSLLERKARGQTLVLGVLIIALALGAVALACRKRATNGQIITVHGKNRCGQLAYYPQRNKGRLPGKRTLCNFTNWLNYCAG
jgi:hypothetical protein